MEDVCTFCASMFDLLKIVFLRRGIYIYICVISESECVSFLVAITNYYKICGLNTTEIYSLTDVEVRNPKSVSLG